MSQVPPAPDEPGELSQGPALESASVTKAECSSLGNGNVPASLIRKSRRARSQSDIHEPLEAQPLGCGCGHTQPLPRNHRYTHVRRSQNVTLGRGGFPGEPRAVVLNRMCRLE